MEVRLFFSPPPNPDFHFHSCQKKKKLQYVGAPKAVGNYEWLVPKLTSAGGGVSAFSCEGAEMVK